MSLSQSAKIALRDALIRKAAPHQLKANEILSEVHKIAKDLKETCDRKCGNIEEKEDYNSGSYLDQAYTVYWESCPVCGYYKSLGTKSHGYYG